MMTKTFGQIFTGDWGFAALISRENPTAQTPGLTSR